MFKWLSNWSREEFTPKIICCLREGYSRAFFWNDLFAGITIGIISLPLAMAFAIGAGVGPERGLFTAIVAGFLISLLGGSRVQIGGPTGAYIVIIFDIIQRHGYAGLAIATLMAGCILIGMGLARCGVLLKFIPYPVTTGFTAGIAVNIFSSQVKDLLGLDIVQVPARFIDRWSLYFEQIATWNPWSLVIAATTLALIFFLRWLYPRVPAVIIGVIFATLAVHGFNLPVETIFTRFGEIPRMLPAPTFPSLSYETLVALFPDAITVALLGAIESLLSAHVADGMTGHRHRSNCELVAQGFANIGSVVFGGIPATGAIARTAANIKLHAKTPIAGMTHAVTVLLLMMIFAPIASLMPMAALAAILTFVAWNMSEREHFIEILKGPLSDTAVLLLSFSLTVLVDLTVAVQGGVVLAAILFLKNMTDATTLKAYKLLLNEKETEDADDSEIHLREDIPSDVAVFEMQGPLFFGVSNLLNEELRLMRQKPKVFILRMRHVPMIDASGIHSLRTFGKKCRQAGMLFLISEMRTAVKKKLASSGVLEEIGPKHLIPTFNAALDYARMPTAAPEALPLQHQFVKSISN